VSRTSCGARPTRTCSDRGHRFVTTGPTPAESQRPRQPGRLDERCGHSSARPDGAARRRASRTRPHSHPLDAPRRRSISAAVEAVGLPWRREGAHAPLHRATSERVTPGQSGTELGEIKAKGGRLEEDNEVLRHTAPLLHHIAGGLSLWLTIGREGVGERLVGGGRLHSELRGHLAALGRQPLAATGEGSSRWDRPLPATGAGYGHDYRLSP
jgi:hypothetical protein